MSAPRPELAAGPPDIFSTSTTDVATEVRPRTPVSVVLPRYNQREATGRLAEVVKELEQSLGSRYAFEYVFVDDGSTDGTYEALYETFAHAPRSQFIRHPVNRGLGEAIVSGIDRARCEFVCSMDCACEPGQLQHMLPILVEGADLVTASRRHPRVRGIPRWRLSLARAASLLYRRLLWSTQSTYISSLRVYRRSAVKNLGLSEGGFGGIVELLWELDRRGARIVECPVVR